MPITTALTVTLITIAVIFLVLGLRTRWVYVLLVVPLVLGIINLIDGLSLSRAEDSMIVLLPIYSLTALGVAKNQGWLFAKKTPKLRHWLLLLAFYYIGLTITNFVIPIMVAFNIFGDILIP